jgi:hypothetical protein
MRLREATRAHSSFAGKAGRGTPCPRFHSNNENPRYPSTSVATFIFDWGRQKLKITSILPSALMRIRGCSVSSLLRGLEELAPTRLRFQLLLIVLQSTDADTVMFYDSDFNPQIDRIGNY